MWDLELGLRKDASLSQGHAARKPQGRDPHPGVGPWLHACNHQAVAPPLHGWDDWPVTLPASPGSGTKHLGQGGPSGPLRSQRETLEVDGNLLPPCLDGEIPVRGALVVPDSTLSY